MSISPGRKPKHWDGASNPDNSSRGDTEDKVEKKKSKMINLDVMYMGSSDVEGTSKRKKCKVNSENQDIESDPMIPKRKKSGDGYIENPTDQETYTKKKRKAESYQDDSVSSIVLQQEYNKNKNVHKAKDSKRLNEDELLTEETPCRENTDLEGRSKERKKKKTKKDHEEQILDHNLVEDLLSVHTHHTKKKKGKWKDGGDLQGDGLTEEADERVDQSETAVKKKKKKRKEESHQETDDIAPYSKLTDQEGRLEKKRKPTKDHREKHLDNSLVEELSTDDIKHKKRKNKKWKGGGDHQEDGFTEKLFSQRKSPDSKETSEEVDDSVDQSETAVKKKKRKEKSHQEADDIAANDGAIASIVLNGEQSEKIKKSHKSKGHIGRHRDGLPGKALYREPADIKDKQSLKNKKDHLIENSSVEEVLISETQHAKKKKNQKGGGGLQDDGFTEKLSYHRKSPDDSDAPEQVDECLDQVEKPKKKKKKRKDESHQEADGIAMDEPSYSELNDTEDRPGQTKEKRSKKVHLECPIEDSILEELLNHFPHDGFTETTEQVVKTVEQTEVLVKKKVKTKKHLDRSEETSGILAEETLKSRVVESNGNVDGDSENTDQTSTSGPSQHQTFASTDTDQNSNTQDNGSTTSGKNTKERVQKRIVKMPFGRKQDIALIKEYCPTIKEGSLRMLIALNQDLERVRNAKQKGIMFRSGQFTKEEDELLKKNVEKFMSQVGIHSPVMLFHPYYFPEQSRTICLLKRKYSFSQRIAEGLYRFCDSVLVRGAKLFHYGENSGRFTEEEKRRLQKYQKLHGDDYVTISKLMSRTVSSSKNKISEMSQEVNTGPWSIEETNLLITAVKEFVLDSLRKENPSNEEPVTIPKRKLYKHIKWEQVYKKVGTRNWTHCKTQWSNIIMTRMNDGLHPFKGNLQKLTSMKMIQWLHDAKVKEYGDVKWDKLCDDIGNVTSFYAQLNLIRLKEVINGWKNMRLYEIVDHLYNVTLPELESLVSAAEIAEPEKKEEFLFSEMFREYTEYEEM